MTEGLPDGGVSRFRMRRDGTRSASALHREFLAPLAGDIDGAELTGVAGCIWAPLEG